MKSCSRKKCPNNSITSAGHASCVVLGILSWVEPCSTYPSDVGFGSSLAHRLSGGRIATHVRIGEPVYLMSSRRSGLAGIFLRDAAACGFSLYESKAAHLVA